MNKSWGVNIRVSILVVSVRLNLFWKPTQICLAPMRRFFYLFYSFILYLFLQLKHDWKVIQMLLGCSKPTAVDSLTANSKFSADADEKYPVMEENGEPWLTTLVLIHAYSFIFSLNSVSISVSDINKWVCLCVLLLQLEE